MFERKKEGLKVLDDGGLSFMWELIERERRGEGEEMREERCERIGIRREIRLLINR